MRAELADKSDCQVDMTNSWQQNFFAKAASSMLALLTFQFFATMLPNLPITLGFRGIMAVSDDDTEEPHGEGEADVSQTKGHRRSFGTVRRELTEPELSAPGVQKMLLDELDRLDGIEKELKESTEKYNESSRLLAVAKEKLKTHTSFDVISTGTMSLGTLIIGVIFSAKIDNVIYFTLLAVGFLLVIVGIVAKVMRA